MPCPRIRSSACGTPFGHGERQTGDDRPAGEQLGMRRKHHRRHRAARRQPVDVDPCRIEVVAGDHVAHHLRDRGGLALPAAAVGRLVPVEAQIVIVRARLLGEQHGKAMPIGQFRPAAPAIVHAGILGAAMEHDNERRVLGEVVGNISTWRPARRDWCQSPSSQRGGPRCQPSNRSGPSPPSRRGAWCEDVQRWSQDVAWLVLSTWPVRRNQQICCGAQ